MPATKPTFSIPVNKITERPVPPSGKRQVRLQDVSRAAIVFVAYFLAGRLGLAVPFTSGNISPVWPASGIALAAVLLWGYRVWPGILGAAFLVNFLTPIPTPAAAAIAVGNTGGALLAGYLLNRIPGFQCSLTRLRDGLGLVGLAAILGPSVPATTGVAALFLGGIRPWSGTGRAWLVWWLGDAMGILVVTPLLLTLHNRDGWAVAQRSKLEWLSLAAGAVITAVLIFHGPRSFGRDDVLAFVVFPFVIWAAVRFGPCGTAAISALIAGIAVWGTAAGHGPFVKPDPLHAAILLQVFIAVAAVSGLLLAAVIAERSRAEDALDREQRLLGERRRAEEALRQSQQRLNGIIESAMDAIITVDKDQRVVVFNKAAQAIFRCPASEALGHSLDEFIPQRFRGVHGEHVRMFAHTGVTSRSMYSPGVLAGLRKNGEEFPIEATISQLEAADQVLFTVILRDISERKQAEEKLRKTEKLAAAGRMAASVAHEINNPLAAVTNLLYLMHTEQRGEVARQYLLQAENELGRVTHIVKETLQFYRDNGAATRFDLCSLIDEALDVFSSAIAAGQVQVHREYNGRAAVIGHAGELRQVFTNLIANSVEAGATLLRIRVSRGRNWGKAKGDGVRVTLVDNGQGLSVECRQHVFEPFFTTKKEKGTGLGLWVTKGIVQKYEGSINLRSNNDPRHNGTCITIFLPSSSPVTGGQRRKSHAA